MLGIERSPVFQRLYDHRSLHVAILSGRRCDQGGWYGVNAGYGVTFFQMISGFMITYTLTQN